MASLSAACGVSADRRQAVFLVLWLVALTLATGRFLMPTHALSVAGAYEAAAHLFVGGLIGAWFASRRRRYLLLAVGLSAVELFAFLTR